MTRIRIQPLGDRAFLARFEDEDSAERWAGAVRAEFGDRLRDVVLAYDSVGVYFDPDRSNPDEVEASLRLVRPREGPARLGKRLVLPVLYDGVDLPEAAQRLGLSPEDVISAHAGQDYRVFALGFQPGFPYAGYLPDALRGLPRRTPPRTRVPGGSVAVVGRQTAVYPNESPGGWHLIGRCPLKIVDLDAGHFPIAAGDRIRFRPVGSEEFRTLEGKLLAR